MLQFVFVLVSVTGVLYFSLAKRQFDFFTLGFFSACIYFLPGYFGFALYPPSGAMNARLPAQLLDETYMVMIIVLAAIFVGVLFFDLIFRKTVINLSFRDCRYVVHTAVGMAILGCILTVFQSGNLLLSLDKHEMMESLSRWHILWVTSAAVGAAISYTQKKWSFLFICISLLLFDLYIGFRSSLAITFVALSVLFFSMKRKIRLIVSQNVMVLFLSVGAFFFFAYKKIYLKVKAGSWGDIYEQFMSIDLYARSITRSEPFTSQVILNEVIRTNFRVDGEHFWGILNNLILFSPSLGLETVSFNDLFQAELFPFHDAGMANNIWAEMWSSGGWWLLSTFVIAFVCVLFVGSCLLRVSDPVIKGGVAIFWSYWAFYIHRNDILYQIVLEKRVFLVWLFCIVLSSLLVLCVRISKKGKACSSISMNSVKTNNLE